jgi:hypothetical protein
VARRSGQLSHWPNWNARIKVRFPECFYFIFRGAVLSRSSIIFFTPLKQLRRITKGLLLFNFALILGYHYHSFRVLPRHSQSVSRNPFPPFLVNPKHKELLDPVFQHKIIIYVLQNKLLDAVPGGFKFCRLPTTASLAPSLTSPT